MKLWPSFIMNPVGIPLVTFLGEEVDKIVVRHMVNSLQIMKSKGI